MSRLTSNSSDVPYVVTAILALVWMIVSWWTHVIVCFKAGSWGFLIAGAIFAPVAFVHGTGVWFGAW